MKRNKQQRDMKQALFLIFMPEKTRDVANGGNF
jgi:hypothetical protein